MPRTSPQKARDERDFPIRILIKVPEMGLGARIEEVHRWLTKNVGAGNHGWQAGGRAPGHDRIAIYLRTLAPAVALLDAFPDLELSDTIEEMAKAEGRSLEKNR